MADEAEEFVVPLDLGVKWDPNANRSLLIQAERTAWLLQDPNLIEDTDLRLVVLQFDRCDGAVLGSPNDEGRPGHRLWDRGLRQCRWAGEVQNSEWLYRKRHPRWEHPRRNPQAYSDHHHFILLSKESTFECIAESVTVTRLVGPKQAAAHELLSERTL